MARDHEIKGVRYWDCDRCGFTVRWNETIINADGFRVCTKWCMDSEAKDPRPIPETTVAKYILTQEGDRLITEAGEYIIQE